MLINRFYQSIAAYAPAPGGGATTTWNPSDKDAAISLSNGNLTATGVSTAFSGVRAVASASSGKKYWEIHVDTLNATSQVSTGMGIATTSFSFPAGYTDGASWFSTGAIYVSGVNTVNTGLSWAQGDTLCLAVDISNNLLWVRVNGGSWNNGTDDPATAVGGINISTRGAGALFAIANVGTSGVSGNDVFTANFGGTAYAQTQPSGYGNW